MPGKKKPGPSVKDDKVYEAIHDGDRACLFNIDDLQRILVRAVERIHPGIGRVLVAAQEEARAQRQGRQGLRGDSRSRWVKGEGRSHR